jgi:hypothetical protein
MLKENRIGKGTNYNFVLITFLAAFLMITPLQGHSKPNVGDRPIRWLIVDDSGGKEDNGSAQDKELLFVE